VQAGARHGLEAIGVSASAKPRARPLPHVWVLTTELVGDNAQMLAIADAVGWPYEVKHLTFSGLNRFHFRFLGPSLHKVDPETASTLTPPWPDLILATARRCTPVAFWLREQSGGRAKIVFVGQMWADPQRFDLFVTTPQYHQPSGPNVYPLQLPMLFPNPDKVRSAATSWEPHLKHLPRPWIVVFVGGPTGPHVLNPSVARDLMDQSMALVERDGGSLLVSTSRRTPDAVCEILEQSMPKNGLFYRWTSDSRGNPFHALLGLGDRFVVTGDSMSMLVEAVRQGKPLAIFQLPLRRRKWLKRLRNRLRDTLLSPQAIARHQRRARVGIGLVNLGLLSYRRDFSMLYQGLIERDLAQPLEQWLGPQPAGDDEASGRSGPTRTTAAPDERSHLRARIRALIEPPPADDTAEAAPSADQPAE